MGAKLKKLICFIFAVFVFIPPVLSSESSLQAISKVSRNVIRTSPHPSAKSLGYLSKGETVAVLQQSSFTAKVGRIQDDWFQVSTLEGKTGWVFGGNLDVNVNQAIVTKLRKKYIGVKSPPFPEETEYLGGRILRHSPNLGLDQIAWHGNVLMIWLNEIVGRLPAIHSKSRDVLIIPPFHYKQRDMLAGCMSTEDHFADLYVVVQEVGPDNLKPLKAWKIDTAKKVFKEISVKSVTCQSE